MRSALEAWGQVWVVDDGSSDGSADTLASCIAHAGLRVLKRPHNGGKGAAVLTGAEAALAEGFTHALVLDADGQHPADRIRDFIDASARHPDHLVLGKPEFGPEAPAVRLQGRKLSVGLVRFELAGPAVEDPLFGFRVYPLAPLVSALRSTRWARGYDFDPEVAVRMVWAGTPTLNIPASCRYVPRDQGGVSHFRYVRDNLRMIWLHTRLITLLVLRSLGLLGKSHASHR